MPVTFKVAEHDANPVMFGGYGSCQNAHDVLASTWGGKSGANRFEELLQSSFPSDCHDLGPQSNGFVDTVIHAYNQHHHLVLRPDDVWIAILGQFNFYVNANAEQLRSKFVAHKGKKKLTVTTAGDRYSVNFGDLANQMTQQIHNNVVDKELKNWILPDFSTTSFNDVVVCSVLMMATLKAYFSYEMCLCCGIPLVTLEGQKEDWEKLLNRLDKLASFGREPEAWAVLLKPILRRFVSSFDGKPDIEFWGKICHIDYGGSGSDSLSGWITAFCVWSNTGKWQGPNIDEVLSHSPVQDNGAYNQGYGLVLDGVRYAVIDDDKIPVGFCEVDVDLNDNGKHFDCMMVSGHMAGRLEGPNRDTLRPAPGWFMFVKYKGPESATAQSLSDVANPVGMRFPARFVPMKPATAVVSEEKVKEPKERRLKRWRSVVNKLLRLNSPGK
ncbi:hypothetical protein JR316_0005823 [Psilocybe cubensis]|uniref:Uncharacterized protein n=2 Tax=Psilocybe cubensis TaxID=181762 RepID=A0ACB8H1E7_PSICU|nr:hypothetical protein JR316_0005823 [Psilocybe cubensis]KAH9481301.1 hypothetical protein JR316_0005823 [Psilocybe cubensis]